ncbi:MAG: GerMN domain-containing protein [Armatimonadota bacterium]|nr:GerMN domain-containing protein [Armatimonadota bacterium]MDR7401590.1 GerMN domain-containing protein [Armatimonadota bacterium]MDR7405055.1 GerMN domain-containing protein [Armatimonadota bacterium]MDR7436857.1 GerMN domain-containing protein [Armatimonadota bacterium]MDR7471602.1 GerMN domain-containing protein [Armatimonadota bacterium]
MSRRVRAGVAAALAAIVGAGVVWWWLARSETTVAVYFIRASDGGDTLQDVSRRVRGRSAHARLRGALQALLSGPTADERARGLTTAIPSGTRLRGLRIEDGMVVVDLSGEVASGGGTASMLGRLWQIVYTATQIPTVPRVRLLIDGQAREALGGEGVLIDRPLSRPPSLPEF